MDNRAMILFYNTWSWLFALLIIVSVVLLAPLSSNTRIRYYAVYACYIFSVSTISLLYTPYFLLRPRNIDNLRIFSKPLRHLPNLLGIKFSVRNEHIVRKKRGAIIVANHQSILDIQGMFCLWEAMGSCTAIAKKELLYVPPFGPAAWLAGLIFIDRKNPKEAFEFLQTSIKLINNVHAKLWLFPEGTRNKKTEKLLPFKKGAFKMAIDAGAPIIPIVYSPYYDLINSKNKTCEKGEVIMSILDEIPTDGLKPEDTGDLMKKTYDLMETEYQKLRLEVNSKYHPNNNNRFQ